MKVDAYRYFFDFGKGVQVYHRYGIIVIGYTITSGIGYIEFIPYHYHLFRLIADITSVHHLQGIQIHFSHIPQSGIGINHHFTRIRTDVSIATVENDIATVRNRDGSQVPCCIDIHHLHQVGYINDSKQFITIYLNIIPHIAQRFLYGRIQFRINVLTVITRSVIEIVQRSLVTSHIPLIQQEKSLDRTCHLYARCHIRHTGKYQFFVVATARGYQQYQHARKPHQ